MRTYPKDIKKAIKAAGANGNWEPVHYMSCITVVERVRQGGNHSICDACTVVACVASLIAGFALGAEADS